MDSDLRASRTAQVRRAGAEFLRLRAALVAPAMVVFTCALWLGREPAPRLVAVATCFSLMLAFFIGEAVVLRRRALGEGYLLSSMLVTQAGIGCVGIATGGLQSPVIPLLFAPTGVGLTAFGRSPYGRLVVVGLFGSLLAIGGGSHLVGWSPLGSPLREGMTVAASLLCVLLLYTAIGSLSDAYVSAGNALARTQSTLLQAATLRAADLEAIGARVSHELKNPLAAVKGLVELVRRHTDDGQKQRLDVALGELERMQATLQDYLAFARPLAPLELSSFDLRLWLEELVAAHEGLAASANVTLLLESPLLEVARLETGTSERPRTAQDASPAATWWGDRLRLAEALGNLLSNAVHACRAGDKVVVRARLEDTRLVVGVEDSGQGMDPEMLSRIGTPYLTSKQDGTGLGVVLARATIAQHAGSLVFESAVGRGTKATIELPRLERGSSTL